MNKKVKIIVDWVPKDFLSYWITINYYIILKLIYVKKIRKLKCHLAAFNGNFDCTFGLNLVLLIRIFLFHVFIKSSMLPFLFMGHIHITAPFRSINIGHRGWLGYAGPITPTLISWPQTFLHILSWSFLKFKRILINMCTDKGVVWLNILKESYCISLISIPPLNNFPLFWKNLIHKKGTLFKLLHFWNC